MEVDLAIHLLASHHIVLSGLNGLKLSVKEIKTINQFGLLRDVDGIDQEEHSSSRAGQPREIKPYELS